MNRLCKCGCKKSVRLSHHTYIQHHNLPKPGSKLSEETKKKMSESTKGNKHSEETKKKMSNAAKKMSEKHKSKISKAMSGRFKEKNNNWKGGIAEYGNGWNTKISITVKKRDGNKCKLCGSKKSLKAHHIDFTKTNHSLNNLITLCNSCHQKVHNGKLNV